LFDGHSLAYRAFFALPVENFSTSTGQPTNAVYGFTSMLINALRDEAPTHVAVAFDVSRATFRSEQYAEYKANRSTSPEPFRGQVELIQEVLAALQIPSVSLDRYEADDLIATLTTQATREGFEVEIITGDRDAFQLVGPDVTVLYPKRGVSDLSRMTPDAVMEKYGLTPEQYPDFAALRGDPSDNLPGIPGVGEKTATKWLTEFGSLQSLVDRADEVPGKAGDALRAHVSQVVQNRQLTQLVTDVPLDVGPADLAWHTWDREAVHQLFDTLEFRVLRDRLYQTLTTAQPETTETTSLDVTTLTSSTIADWLTAHAGSGGRHGVAVSGWWRQGTGDVTALAIASAAGPVGWVALSQLDDQGEQVLARWWADPQRHKALHDANGPLLALTARGWQVAGLVMDTALATYLLRPDQRSYDLGDLSVRYLHRELHPTATESGPSGGNQPLTLDLTADTTDDAAGRELGATAAAVRDLAEALDAQLTAHAAADLLIGMELPLTQVLVGMEQVGVAIDVDELEAMRQTFADEVKAAAEQAFGVIGHEVNLGSPKQLQTVLFEELELPKTKRIKTGYTTDADALAGLFAQTEHPFLAHLLRHRDVSRLLVTVEGLQRSVADDGRIHTTFSQIVAATGRLSSTEPNLQNVPVRTAEGRRIRQAFVVGEGYATLMTADYSQVEMRIMAHLSGDEELIAAFRSGEDLHTTVASRVFDVAPDDVDARMRSRIKAMSYGLAYGLSAYGLSQQLGITPDEAQSLMTEYFERFGGVRDYLAGVVDEARRTGYTQTVLGRRRYLPDLTSDNRRRREMAERMALNAPIQGSAADIVKVAMLDVDRRLRDAGLASRMLLQVHDELVLEVAADEVEPARQLVTDAMCGAYELRAPLAVSIGLGRSWDDAAH